MKQLDSPIPSLVFHAIISSPLHVGGICGRLAGHGHDDEDDDLDEDLNLDAVLLREVLGVDQDDSDDDDDDDDDLEAPRSPCWTRRSAR